MRYLDFRCEGLKLSELNEESLINQYNECEFDMKTVALKGCHLRFETSLCESLYRSRSAELPALDMRQVWENKAICSISYLNSM